MNPAEALGHLTRVLLHGAPRPPVGVRARVGEEGPHEWVALFDIDPDTVEGMHVDLLPGMTSVSFAFPTTPEDSP